MLPPPPPITPRRLDPHWHPHDDAASLDIPRRHDCDCLLHPCLHDAQADQNNPSSTDTSTTTDTQTADTEPPIFDDEPPF